MREELERFVGQKINIRARVSAVSSHAVAIEKIKVNNEVEIDHVWCQRDRVFENIIGNNVRRGQIIESEGEVYSYSKRTGEIDYGIGRVVIV